MPENVECIFCKIIKNEIPSSRVFEDEKLIAFLDINPVSHGHTLLISKKPYIWMQDVPDELLGKLFIRTKKLMIAMKSGLGCDYVQVSVVGKDGKIEVININCATERLDGFSGHSDYNQLMSYIHRLRPKLRRVIVNHGERRKCENLASSVHRMFRIATTCPQVQEGIRLL